MRWDYRWAEAPGIAGAWPVDGRNLGFDVRGIGGQAEVDDLEIDLALSEDLDGFGRTEPWGGWGTGGLGATSPAGASRDDPGARGLRPARSPSVSVVWRAYRRVTAVELWPRYLVPLRGASRC